MDRIHKVVFFGYGGAHMGMGHIMRIATLANAFIDKLGEIEVTVVVPEYEEGIDYLRRNLNSPANIIPVDKSYSEKEVIPEDFPKCDVAVFDCLNNPARRLQAARRKAALIVTFDDSAEGVCQADIAFNPLYFPRVSIQAGSVVVYGEPGYMPLRPEFADYHGKYGQRENRGSKKRILILQGGVDGWNGISRIIGRLGRIRKHIVAVPVVGKTYAHMAEMKRVISEVGIEVELHQDIPNMAEFMSGVDGAISGCGLSIFELLCIGVPSITLTDEGKELETAERLAGYGCVVNLGCLSRLSDEDFTRGIRDVIDDTEQKKSLSACGIKQINGHGADRVVDKIIARHQELRG